MSIPPVSVLSRRVLAEPWRRRFRAELAWVLLGVPFTLAALVVVLAGLAVGVVTSPLFLGLLVLSGVLMLARGFGAAQRRSAAGLLGIRVAAPAAPALRPGLWTWIRAHAGDPIGWRAVAYLVLRLPVALVSLAVVGAGLIDAIALVTYPYFWFTLNGKVSPVFDIYAEHWISTLPLALAGVAVFFALPWLLHLLLGLDRLLVRGLLAPVTLSERVRDLEESRSAAVQDADVRLRRVERDLHDGAQAQLVALAMKLGIAKDELAGAEPDVEQLRALVTTAHANAKQALVELRDLARGIHPPALDAGLDVALSTLIATTGSATLSFDVPRRPPPPIETIAYFTVAELLTNAAKHGRTDVLVDVTGEDYVLRLTVSDAGQGGARLVPGGGLAGIADRLRAVDGGLVVTSPPGGPTVITAAIPFPS